MTAPTVNSRAPNDAERACTHIRRGIIEELYPPGARLVEQQVSMAVSASRTPVREAIRRLESQGLVVTERNRGAHVRPPDRASIVDAVGRHEGDRASRLMIEHSLQGRDALLDRMSALRDDGDRWLSAVT